jgi:hypothetical protein
MNNTHFGRFPVPTHSKESLNIDLSIDENMDELQVSEV